ncbi:MAG TPA: LysR family transcriptional regulator [Burkholderiaceae bacterium]|nr:LysR family transcriptional regulator [Burkholderiaceae bacterium]
MPTRPAPRPIDRRSALTPDALAMMDAIAKAGSFAAAARELGKVPSALTYSVRQLEDALDVLLFDRRSGQAQLTAAGEELLREGRRLLAEMDAVANRVRRVACGWETQLTVAADGVVSRITLFELCEAFFALRPDPEAGTGPGTRLRLRTEVLAGTWEALLSGEADLAIGVGLGAGVNVPAGVAAQPLGEIGFVFAVAPHHPLAAGDRPLDDAELVRHRAVAVADSARRHEPLTLNLLPGQEVFTVGSMQAKLEAQLRCLGCGFLPEPIARDHIAAGRLVVRQTRREAPRATLGYAWRSAAAPDPRKPPQGLALGWWLEQLASAATRRALLERHCGLPSTID